MLSSKDAASAIDVVTGSMETMPVNALVALCEYLLESIKGPAVSSGLSFLIIVAFIVSIKRRAVI